MSFSWRAWLKRLGERKQRTRPIQRRERYVRLQLEELESRRVPATLTVNSIADAVKPDNQLTLREAIQVVNGTLPFENLSPQEQNQIDVKTNPLGTKDTIIFNIGAGTQTIAVTGRALDTIKKPVTIDGTAPAANPDQVIVLDGTSFQIANVKNVNGLTIVASNVVVKNLTIQNFTNYGIQVTNAKGDTIASDTISGNTSFGLSLDGAGGNFIGTYDPMTQQASGNTIASNKQGGVRVAGKGDNGNTFYGNTIVNNTGIGISLDINADSTQIGLAASANAGNTIAGNSGNGISMASSKNGIYGNLIGIQDVTGFPDGLVDPNGGDGISVNGNGNTIGAATARNIISGNAGNGIRLGGNVSGNTLTGNLIGTNLTGNDSFDGKGRITGNSKDGVLIAGAAKTSVVGNFIASNLGNGVEVQGDGTANTSGNTIANNFIGASLDVDPTTMQRTPLENGKTGILVNAAEQTDVTGNQGFKPADQNAIKIQGVKFPGQEKGNQIETPPPPPPPPADPGSGGPTVPNMVLLDCSGVTVTGNVLDGGLSILGSSGIVVQGNYIGVDASGHSFSNPGNGITIDQSSNNNTIDGANMIEDNGRAGVSVLSGTGNQISQNVITGNGALGIDLNGDGVTPNTPGGPHSGPNLLQNYPVLNSATLNGGNLAVSGSLNSTPNTTFTVEFFGNSSPDPSGHGQGQSYLGSLPVTTDGSGNVSFSITLPNSFGSYVSATATDPAGNTSEFSGTQPINVTSPSINLISSVNPSTVGQAVTFTASLSGFGSPPSGSVTFEDNSAAIGSGTITSAGTATFTTSSLTAGNHTITAVFGNYSHSLTQIVNLIGTSTYLTSDTDPATVGQAVTFTATVVAPSGTPTGSVTFEDGSSVLGTGMLDANGNATFATSSLAIGTHTITATYGGDGMYTGSSATLSQVIQQAPSVTSLTSSSNPALPGQSVTFTAAVSAAGGAVGTPTGTVTFQDGTTTLGTVTLDSNGNATFTTSALVLGSHNITAVYSGDSSFTGSSASLTEVISQEASSTTSLSSSVNPSAPGQAVTFTASVSGGSGTPTGTVTFLDEDTVLGTVTLDGFGNATLTTSSLSLGDQTITASYSGDAVYNSSSASLVQSVNYSPTSTSLTSSVDPSQAGQAVTFTATVSTTASGTPTGTITFLDGSTILGTATLSPGNGASQATFTTTSLAVGSHSITAYYGGDGTFEDSSAFLTQLVNQAQSSTSLTSSLNPSHPGQSVTFTATVSATGGAMGTPTGTVTFSDGSTVLGTVTLSPGNGASQATFTTASLAAGNHTITATYGGDPIFSGSSASLTQQVVTPALTSTSLTSSINPSHPGQAMTLTATVTTQAVGTPTGTVTFYDGSTVLGTAMLGLVNGQDQAMFTTSSLQLGNHTLYASYSGDSYFAASYGGMSQTVNQAQTSLSLTSSADPSQPGQSVTFTATVSTTATGVGIPSGTVTFSDGSTVLGTGTLAWVNGQAQATFTASGLAVGDHSIAASYGGDGTFAGSYATMTQSVVQAQTSIMLASSANPSMPGQAVTFTATVMGSGMGGAAPTGTVTFYDGMTVLGTVSLSLINGQDQAVFTTSSLSPGSHTITAEYNGDPNYNGSYASLTQTVTQGQTSMMLMSSLTPSQLGQPVTFTATVGATGTMPPTGTVTFYDGSTALGTVSLSQVNGQNQAAFTTSTLTSGSHTITATYSGDTGYSGCSASLTQTVE